MTTFYRVDGGKLTYAEYWRMSREPLSFLIAAIKKLMRFPIQFKFAIPRPDQLFVVEFDELPAAARYSLAPPIDAAEAAGLHLEFCHRLAVPEPHRLGVAAVMLDDTGQTCFLVSFAQHGAVREVQLSCVSKFPDDMRGVTVTIKKKMEPVRGSYIARHPGANPATLLARHRDHLAHLATEGLIAVKLDPSELEDFILDGEQRYVDFHVGRGVFVPMTDEELDVICERDW